MYNPSIWSKELSGSRRSYLVSVLRAEPKKTMHIRDLAAQIGYVTNEPIPDEALKTNSVFHATTYRRLLSGDIDALNRDPGFPFAILSDGSGVRLCGRDECEKLYNMERKEALKKLAKCSIIARKAGLDGQITVTGDEVRAFMEEEATA